MKIEKNSDLLDLPLKSAYRLIAATIPSKIFICIHPAKCFAWVVLVGGVRAAHVFGRAHRSYLTGQGGCSA